MRDELIKKYNLLEKEMKEKEENELEEVQNEIISPLSSLLERISKNIFYYLDRGTRIEK